MSGGSVVEGAAAERAEALLCELTYYPTARAAVRGVLERFGVVSSQVPLGGIYVSGYLTFCRDANGGVLRDGLGEVRTELHLWRPEQRECFVECLVTAIRCVF